jgi:serine phosphatase RsbU (regulator of sigma subunit)
MLTLTKKAISGISTFLSGLNISFSKRWPIIFWFGAFFCFFAFPLFLIDVGLDSYLSTRLKAQKKQTYYRLNNRLELLLQYGNSRHYYHAILKKIFNIATTTDNPIDYLSKALPYLKKRNPKVFRFIVWDEKGKTINHLTDEKSYKYIVRTLYEAFLKATSECLENYPGNPSAIPLIDKRLNLLRSYLGAFFIPERLNLVYLRGILGECIMASSEPEKSHFWYQIDNKFGIFANISNNAIESNRHLEKIVYSLNKNRSSRIKVGIAQLIEDNQLKTDTKLKSRPEILIELGKYLNTTETDAETSSSLMVIKPVTPFVLGFAIIPKTGLVTNPSEMRNKILSGIAVILAIIGIITAYLVFKSRFFSIRWKLILLFAYANGLPLMIFGFLGMEYLQQTKTQMLDHTQKKISDMISNIDYRFNNVLNRYATELNKKTDEINTAFANNGDVEKAIAEYEALADSLKPIDFIISEKTGEFKVFKCLGRKTDSFIQNMAKILLAYLNQNYYTPRADFETEKSQESSKTQPEQILSGEGILFEELLQKTGKIEPQQMAAEERLYYWNYLGDIQNREINYLTMMSWPHEKLQERYIQEFLPDFNKNDQKVQFFAMIETNGITFPKNEKRTEIHKLFRQTFNFKTIRADRVTIDNEIYAAYGSVGRYMNKVALLGVSPMQLISDYVDRIRLRLVMFIFLSLCLTSGIGIMLARQFLEPVKELEKGVKAIGSQNFRYRIPVRSADEFGHLSTVFNQAIESLEELEIAQVVQENLFPAEPLEQNSVNIFGKSVSMTRLGGDYFDYYSLDQDHVGILMGDVAGHGVPAALLMAMAKASVLLAEESQKHSPAELLKILHRVIFSVKSKKVKRMMTCQYFCLNSQTGKFKFSNAGHCFPALVKNNGSEVDLIKHIGTPLGITKRARYNDEELQLENGDVMVLYSDGIIETKNSEGKELGFEPFKDILLTSFSTDLEIYYQNIFNAYLEWSPTAEDDITIVLFKFTRIEEGKP